MIKQLKFGKKIKNIKTRENNKNIFYFKIKIFLF